MEAETWLKVPERNITLFEREAGRKRITNFKNKHASRKEDMRTERLSEDCRGDWRTHFHFLFCVPDVF